ncbi:glycosyltransferase family 8 protein [Blautia liquoris]|uniref:Glycosyltransferase family 8 protein n=1 Tax=Blautia liquoris TaxID=2779518 RepID=A0A7M2RH70_9FIRM|nr:glycosyltransferase family 8 protein [Blautia liquoris]QOV18897.1 glycosyltransferase family 8 protein [Blautia liquoris]
MNREKESIPIFFTIDDGYAPFLGVALSSMLKNASRDYHYEVFVIYQELSRQNREKLASCKTGQSEIHFVRMKEKLEMIQDHISNRLRADYFTLTIYFRLFIPEMFPQFDKGIYLDSDIVVPGDISRLYQTQLGDHLLGAAVDPAVSEIPELERYVRLCVGVDPGKYFNSGVLLMNLRELRKANLAGRFLRMLSRYHFDTIAPDQDYLNALCSGRVTYLSKEWDTMPSVSNKKKPETAIDNGEINYETGVPKLIHYNLFAKPWYYDGIQYEEYFWHYAPDSGFLDEIQNIKASYTDKDRQSDSEHMALIIARGDNSSKNPVTFRIVFTEGKEARL